MADRGLILAAVNNGLKLEFGNSEVARKNLADARNRLKKRLEKDPSLISSGKFANILDEYLDELDTRISKEMGIESSLNRGIKDGKSFVGDAAGIPQDSSFYGWTPSIPLQAIALAESEMATLIRKTTDELKEKTLRAVQSGIAQGADIGDIQNQILGLGIRGLKGKDGLFRSATARAEMQARTVTNDLINRGAMITYNGVDKVAPELGIKKVWQSVSDRRTSDRCISLLGQIRDLNVNFQSSDGWSGANPPSHPNCRSRVTCTTAKYKEEWDNRWNTEGQTPKISMPVKVDQSNNPRLVEKKEVKKEKPIVREISEENVSFSNPNYNANSLNKAFNELAKTNPELGRRLDEIVGLHQKEKISLLFHDSQYSGKDDEDQIRKFSKFLENRKNVNPDHFSAKAYSNPALSRIWLRVDDSSGFTGEDSPFIMMRTDKLKNKVLRLDNDKLKESNAKLAERQRLVQDAYKDKRVKKSEIKNYLYGNTLVPGDNGEMDEDLWFMTTFIHESGHRVQYSATKKDPKFGVRPAKMKEEENISRYATVNDKELFAEGFTWYTVDPDTMKKQAPNYYKWIDDAWNLVK